jgi:predicted RNA-binding protein Jag
MESIIAKGRSVEEAICLGLAQLEATREEVEIEVIRQEKKRLFGFGSQEAVVKLTKKAVPKPPEREAKARVENGQLFYECVNGEKPTVTIGAGVKLFRNGEEACGTVSLEEGDKLEVIVEIEERTAAVWHVTTDARGMQATLTIEPAVRRRYVLPDHPPAKHLRLRAEVHEQAEHDVTYEDVMEKLKQLRIVPGIQEEAIQKALKAAEKVSVIIAEGTPPEEGQDGWVELTFAADQSKKPKMREDGTVDYRETEIIASAQAGDVIAVIHPPQPGIPGKRVTGELIPVRDGVAVNVQLGHGVAISEDGTAIIAERAGRPQVVKRGRTAAISMIPKLVHRGDVDLSTGHIRFKGDIDIIGNVEEGMEVEAAGSVVVFQNVNRAKVQAQQSVLIHHNLISGTVVSGENKIIIAQLTALLETIHRDLERLTLAVQQLAMLSKLDEKDIRFAKKRLLETKFQPLVEAIEKYREICQAKKERLDETWRHLADQLHAKLLAETPSDARVLAVLANLLNAVSALIHQREEAEVDSIEIAYALNSVIHGSGHVTVTGKGCYNCNIYAGGTLTVNGVLRGGEAHAQKGICVKEAGSSSGVKTVLAVPKGETIRIGLAWEGTVLHIGQKVHTLIEQKKNVHARWDDETATIRLDAH